MTPTHIGVLVKRNRIEKTEANQDKKVIGSLEIINVMANQPNLNLTHHQKKGIERILIL